MIQITDKKNCCGCNACGDVCAQGAISFKTDLEGFWYPEVDTDKCTNCGLCEKVCPIINVNQLKKNDFEKPLCYAAIHKNLEVRFDSTSGGMFSAFAERMYREQGYVGGAIFNDDFTVRQYISADREDLKKLRSSKYQQSNFEGFYKQVKSLLKAGNKVLVCGGPCQMAALRAYLGYEDYENLIVLDYVCRGINSPLVERKYRESLEHKHGSKTVYTKAKVKELGWDRLASKFVFANGDVEYLTRDNNLMTRGYLYTGSYARPSCYDCKFKGFPRISDISLADFWGIQNVAPELHDNIGTSLVLVNSNKGQAFFDKVSQKIKKVEVSVEDAVAGNPAIYSSLELKDVDREQFFKDINNSDFEAVANKWFPFPQKRNKGLKVWAVRTLHPLCEIYKNKYKLGLAGWLNYIKYNYLSRQVKADIVNKGYILPLANACIQIDKSANVLLKAPFVVGYKRVKGSQLETRLLVEAGATLNVQNRFLCYYGGDIEVFRGAKLIIKSAPFPNVESGANIGLTIICGNSIEIGYDVKMGRNVTIRDNNGGHYVSLQGYAESKPVIIGNHVWLCEGCTIMPGVKIGDGAIVSAHSVVTMNVPANSLVAGNPAKVIMTNINWKY